MVDPADLSRIHTASFAQARGWSAAEFAALLSSPFTFVEACDDGFALGREIAGESELLTIAVLPGARGRGLGRSLLQRFEQASAARGAELLFLEVAADNLPARALYQRAEWIESGQRVGYYTRADGSKQDAIVMQKQVTLG
ncbi:GNAT family N-acetyltransferase [Aliiroseovarius crassostreae]|uniref:GNAT family N-acetyltransferase n=1 Tax=Aliiroseovarius crassostreae TaxID=154981 RepID=UPI003C7BB060